MIVHLARAAQPRLATMSANAACAAHASEEQRTEKTYLDPDREPFSGRSVCRTSYTESPLEHTSTQI